MCITCLHKYGVRMALSPHNFTFCIAFKYHKWNFELHLIPNLSPHCGINGIYFSASRAGANASRNRESIFVYFNYISITDAPVEPKNCRSQLPQSRDSDKYIYQLTTMRSEYNKAGMI